MHTIPNVSVNPTTLSGDLSVLTAFIQLTFINFGGCRLVTGRCGVGGKQLQMCGRGKGERGEWVACRDFYLGVKVYHTESKTLSTHTLTSGDLSALAALINLVELNCYNCILMTGR